MKYFVKLNENKRAEMLLTAKHPSVEGFIEIELTDEQYNEISKDLGRYTLETNGVELILKYIPKTAEEISIEEKMEYDSLMYSLRKLREEECFTVINRGYLWYKQLTDEQLGELETWYKDWLDVTEKYVIPEKLSFI